MRYLTLAAATFAVIGFAMPVQADNNIGPRQQGNKCYVHQSGDALGYWRACPSARPEAARTNTNNSNRNTNTAATKR